MEHDFYQIKEREVKKGLLEIYPDFRITRSKDLMVRAKTFYALWDEEKGLWTTDEYDVQRLIDKEIAEHKVYSIGVFEDLRKYLSNFGSNSWLQFRNYISHLSDNSTQLDENLTFLNTPVKKEDHVSKRLPYSLAPGDISAYDELIGVLYSPEERAKIEWAIGSIVAGDSKTIQKCLVFYGSAGTGKSTILNIIEKLFVGYWSAFEVQALTSGTNSFALEAFKENPLVAINHDGDMSKISDNTKFNSVVSHETQTMNAKFKPGYDFRIISMLFVGTNSPVKITDAKSGIIRRLIDVQPTGNKIPPRRYQALYSQIDFELGAIAQHCLDVYRSMGKDFYESYRAIEMMLQTDVYFNFIEEHFDLFKEQDGVTLSQAYDLYKAYCEASGVEYKVAKYKFREELKNYFNTFEERALIDNVRVRSWYSGFLTEKFKVQVPEEKVLPLVLDEEKSLFDVLMGDCYAQYANAHETPVKAWSEVTTKLFDLDTSLLHYVRVPETHIVIDFDLRDENGDKSAELNLEAASKWPATYTEYSKSGGGIHLHYIYAGDPTELSRIYAEGIEVKVYSGNSSLRRKLSRCNNVPVAGLPVGALPIKEKKVMNSKTIQSEKMLRDQIKRNLRKEIHPGTKSSVDFIHKILEDAYQSGLVYDVTDMRNSIVAFANNSTNQPLQAIRMVQSMRFHSEVVEEATVDIPKNGRLVFFDVEVFPNLFVICWKFEGPDNQIVRMINPTPQAVEELMSLMLVGYNCRRYDNHILYGAYMGLDNLALYQLSKRIINNVPNSQFREAYNVSYTDIFDFVSKKQSLKKYQLELGIPHKELGLPWDEPVPPELWDIVAEYCDNDVFSTEVVFEARKQDFIARQILADLSGLPVNATTQQHTSKIVFGEDRRPQDKFIYTDLASGAIFDDATKRTSTGNGKVSFPGYKFELGKSTYKGEEVGEGGYVYSEPGMYENVALLDVASMHPTSIETLNLFGEYTKNFSDLKAARMAIKHKDYDAAKGMLGGVLAPYLDNPEDAEALSFALKIVINIVYGLTAARFDNSFKDPRNIDNIVAKFGALFMIDLKEAVQAQGYTVAHIKTDSIKIPNADRAIIEFVMEFGNVYGYTFEHEATYDKMCLVNDAVYIAKTRNGREPAKWTAVGAQFAEPYVFKTLFSEEKIQFKDMCLTKTVKTALYLDFTGIDTPMALETPGLHFVGKAGTFCPIKPDHGGARLVRENDGKYDSATGAKGYFWLEAEMVKSLHKEKDIDVSYFNRLVDEAVAKISQYGDFEWFTNNG